MRRVVITGLGLLSPVGNNVSDSWKNILSGTSGAKTIDRFDVSKFETQFAATVDIELSDYGQMFKQASDFGIVKSRPRPNWSIKI